MRPLFRWTGLILVALLSAAPHLAHAQLGVALTYGTDTEIGAQVSYYRALEISDDLEGLRAGGDLTLYLPQDFGNEFAGIDATVTYLEVNANGQYAFEETEERRLYALGGLNYAYVTFSGDDLRGVASSNGDVGLNLGGGGELLVGFGRAFAEAKFTLGGFSQLGLLLGLRFGG